MKKTLYYCKKCNFFWYYPVKKCIYCKNNLVKKDITDFKVIGSTKINIPSRGHESVPYNAVLLKDKKNNYFIQKTNKGYNIGEKIRGGSKKEEKTLTVGIVGAGQMGKGIAEIALLNNYRVILNDRNQEMLGKTNKDIEKSLLKVLSLEEKDRVLKNFTITPSLEDLKNADIVIEAIIEDLDIKLQLLKSLEKICKKDTILATNTSSLLINDLAKLLENKKRFLGIHFFNPASKMILVEIIKGRYTSSSTLKKAQKFIEGLHKKSILVKDSPCFVVNRILMSTLNEAASLLEEKISSVEDIDKAVKLGLNHPLGPFELLDLIGLDVFVAIMNNLYKMKKLDKYKPSPLILEMVKKNKLGRKTKEGFYKY